VALEQAAQSSVGQVPLTEEAARDFAERWQIAWNSRRAEEVVALCTDDVLWEDPLTEGREQGKPAVTAYLESTWRTFPDLNFTWPEGPYCSF
jgi:ketosteroid isomerase-like protein